jgi:glucose/arabinose dehydrogenase
MYGIAFDSNTGLEFESGDTVYDEISVLKKGGNYGFPTYQPANEPPELSNSTIDIKPI